MLVSWKQKGVSGDFATASNWDPAEVPGSADDAIIGAKGKYIVTSSVDETVDSLTITNKHATLLIEGASRFSDTFGGVNDGTIVVDGSSRMFLGTNTTDTTLSNVGTIDLVNSSLWIGQFGGPALVSVTGGGHIDLSGGAIRGGGATMVTDNTISGTGSIDFSIGGQEAAGHLINQGIVDASTPNGTLSISRTFIENSSILEATNGGLLEFVVAPVHNAAQGVVEAKGENSEVIMGSNLLSGHDTNAGLIAAVDSGTLLLLDVFGLDNTHGTIEAGHGSTIGLEGDTTIVGGLVTVLQGGIIEAELTAAGVQGASTITGALVTNAGTVGAEGANLTIIGDVTNKGTLDANNATLVIDGAVSGGKATLEGTGEIEFGAASAADVTFAANANAILKLDNPSAFSGTVAGFTTGDYIDLTNINFADNPTLSFSSETHVLTVTDSVSHVTVSIAFKGALGSFSAQSDGNGGTLISDPPATVTVSHDSFVFAANLGENGSTASNPPMHHEPIDFSHFGWDADLVALMGQAHAEEAHLTAAADAIDGHHAAALAAHHFLV